MKKYLALLTLFIATVALAEAVYVGKDFKAGIDSKHVRVNGDAGAGYLELETQSADPSSPTGDDLRIFTKDQKVYQKNATGIVKGLGGGGSSSSGVNLLTEDNWNFEDGDVKWTETGSSVFSITSTAGEVGFELKSGKWDPSASGEYLTSEAITVPNGLKGKLCVLEINYNGGDSNVDMLAWDGSAEIGSSLKTLQTVSGWATSATTFICPSSGTVAARFASTADAAAIYLDNIHLGTKDIITAIDPRWPSYDKNEVSISSAPAGWATDTAYYLPYQAQDGTWRLIFNIFGTHTATSDITVTITIDGVTFAASAYQSISGSRATVNNVTAVKEATTAPSSGLIGITCSLTGTTTVFKASGDVALASKPTWATKTAPDVYLAGMPDTDALGGDWETYTPTINGLGSGGTTLLAAQYRRDGDSADFRFRFRKDGTAGTGSSAVTFSLPTGLTVNSDKLTDVSSHAGSCWTSANIQCFTNIGTSDLGVIFIGKVPSAYTVIGSDVTANSFWNLKADGVPIKENGVSWTTKEYLANAITGFNEATADKAGLVKNNVVSMLTIDTQPAGTISGGYNNVVYGETPLTDTHSAYDTGTGIYTVSVSGIYSVNATIRVTDSGTWSADEKLLCAVEIDGSVLIYGITTSGGGEASLQASVNISGITLAAGQTINIASLSTGTTASQSYFSQANSHWFSISKIGSGD